MKKIILLASLAMALNAGVYSTTIGCEDKKSIIKLKKLIAQEKNIDNLKLYKYAQNENCHVIEPTDKIKLVVKPEKRDGYVQIYVDRLNRQVYIKDSQIKNKFTEEKNLLNKSF